MSNFLRLYKKVQDNMNKRAPVEKKNPSTFEKDKEDHSKCYLSYPKPPVLDMKWQTRDINVVERANTEKFSKLGNIVTLLRFLKLFFDDILVDMIFGYTKLYNHREKADISFDTTNERIWLFLSMLPLSLVGAIAFRP